MVTHGKWQFLHAIMLAILMASSGMAVAAQDDDTPEVATGASDTEEDIALPEDEAADEAKEAADA